MSNLRSCKASRHALYNSPEHFDVSTIRGCFGEDLGKVLGTFLEDCWEGFWDMLGHFSGDSGKR